MNFSRNSMKMDLKGFKDGTKWPPSWMMITGFGNFSDKFWLLSEHTILSFLPKMCIEGKSMKLSTRFSWTDERLRNPDEKIANLTSSSIFPDAFKASRRWTIEAPWLKPNNPSKGPLFWKEFWATVIFGGKKLNLKNTLINSRTTWTDCSNPSASVVTSFDENWASGLENHHAHGSPLVPLSKKKITPFKNT